MYEAIKSVIVAGGYKLAEIQRKIKKLYILGDFSDDQMDELLSLASGGVSADGERPENLELIRNLSKKVADLESRVAALEGVEDSEVEYPVWKAWDGISKDYQQGTVVSHNGQLWESVFAGQNVWEPGAAGTDTMWIPVAF